jgi:hypothetical protein
VFARRNHYNPCFWTALWNVNYYEQWLNGQKPEGKARDQTVLALNVRADKILETKVDRVHFDTDVCVAEMTADSLKRFYKKNRPQEYAGFCRYVDQNPESLYIDFEDILSAMEHMEGYRALMTAARMGGTSSATHKGYLAYAFVLHAMRSHEFMTSMLEEPSPIGLEKWEYFYLHYCPVISRRAATGCMLVSRHFGTLHS